MSLHSFNSLSVIQSHNQNRRVAICHYQGRVVGLVVLLEFNEIDNRAKKVKLKL